MPVHSGGVSAAENIEHQEPAELPIDGPSDAPGGAARDGSAPTEPAAIAEVAGNAAAEHLSPAFPERAAWGTA